MRHLQIIVAFLIITSLYGCAHRISVTPDSSRISYGADDPDRISGPVGYYIAADLINLEVITPGGGGDRVKYFPYREIEAGYKAMLGTIFEKVVKLETESPSDPDVRFVFSPLLLTNSGSTSFATWPPTSFSADLTSRISDRNGKRIANPRVVGNGAAQFSELIRDKGLAGRRAMLDALQKMQVAIRQEDLGGVVEFSTVPKGVEVDYKKNDVGSGDLLGRLRQLDKLYEDGVISHGEFQERRAAILDSL